jgi:beta-N-acetylhexosaminidase
MSKDLRELCGQLVVGGFSGDSLPKEMAGALAQGRRGGVIFFQRNLPSLEAARSLSESVVAAAPPGMPPFIGVDQEGGRVARLKAPFLKLPPMRAIGRLDDVALVERVGRALGSELSALGFNLDFAPVLDVDSNPQNPVIGDRAFSADPVAVARLAPALARGLEASGVLACGKHFPGHGDTHLDSHLDLPTVAHDEARLRAIELVPFAEACRARISTLMTAHVVYDAFDPGVPATLSRKICTDLLRAELGFSGVLFSDDLEMRALFDRMSVEESAIGAIVAGCDALLICSDVALQERALEALIREAEKDAGFGERVREAAERGLVARRRAPPRPVAADALSASTGGSNARALEDEIASRLAPR